MMHLLRSLPDPNLITFLTLLEHLKRYSTHTHTHTTKWVLVLHRVKPHPPIVDYFPKTAHPVFYSLLEIISNVFLRRF